MDSQLLEKFGLATVLLLMTVGAGFALAKWLAPRIDKIIDGHMKFLLDVSASLTVIMPILQKLDVDVSRLKELIEDHLIKSKEQN